MCTNNKIHETFCVLEGKFTQVWIKFGDVMYQFCVCYSTIICTCINMKQLEND